MEKRYDVLIHAGVKGMRWGIIRWIQRRKLKKRLAQGREKAKQRKLEKEAILRDPAKLKQHLYEFSPAEIQSALTRFNQAKQLDELAKFNTNTAKRYIDTASGYLSSIDSFSTKLSSIANTLDKFGSSSHGQSKKQTDASTEVADAIKKMFKK